MEIKREIITVCYASQKSNLNLQKSLFIFTVYLFTTNYRRKLDLKVILKFLLENEIVLSLRSSQGIVFPTLCAYICILTHANLVIVM